MHDGPSIISKNNRNLEKRNTKNKKNTKIAQSPANAAAAAAALPLLLNAPRPRVRRRAQPNGSVFKTNAPVFKLLPSLCLIMQLSHASLVRKITCPLSDDALDAACARAAKDAAARGLPFSESCEYNKVC